MSVNRQREIINKWKKSRLYTQIEKRINRHFSKKLKNKEFTILCSNCVGGILYHRLGQEFLSPTINMWFHQPDFVEFTVNLDWYLNQDLVFIESKEQYPVGVLKGNDKDIQDITLFFNHAKTVNDAKEQWERRKKRIVKDNLYIMMYKLDGITIEQMRKLEHVKCKNKVIFTSVPLPEIPWSYYIKPVMSHKYPYNYLEKDIFGIRYLEKKFDCVSFLNDVPVQELSKNSR